MDQKATQQLVKSLDELDFDKMEMVRGHTPNNIEELCLQLCKDYLSGNWSKQTVDTITVKRLTGGMMNQMYYCVIKDPDHSEKVPQEVAIRLYGKPPVDETDKSRLRDLVISLIFSEKNIGPKVYGIFEQGQILKYYKVDKIKLMKMILLFSKSNFH